MLVLDSLSRQQKHNKNLVKYVDYVHSGVRVVSIVITYVRMCRKNPPSPTSVSCTRPPP